MPDWPITLRRAAVDDMGVAVRLIEEAADWLRDKGSDQWARPWPNRAGRDSRILESLSQGKTWIGWDDAIPAATITADPGEDPYWPDDLRREPAVYVHRLVVRRLYKGAGLGAALLDWTGWTARCAYGARWIRVSAWSTNTGLHEYYQNQGFRRRRLPVGGPLLEAHRAQPARRPGPVQGVLDARPARVIVALPRTASPS
jgi:GNAT superfamily N-acetyltransferase